MPRTIGIDLGTTNSVVAYVVQDRVETIPNSEGAMTTPSIVLFGEEEILVGELAKRQYLTKPGFVIRSAKRLMGKRFSEVEDFIEDFPFEVVAGEEGRAEIRLEDGRVIPPELAAAQVLKKMVETAEDFTGDDIHSAVITVPAYFNDAQRTATKRATDLIDLEVVRIINEPTAASLAYGFAEQGESRRIAVFDFGGGTFDISILQLQGDIFEVLSTNGNTQLGGDNIDQKVFDEVSDAILQSTGIDPTQDRQAMSRIREAAEKAKIELSSLQSTHISLPFIVADSQGPKHYEGDITRDQFNEWMQPFYQMLFDPCRMALEDAHLGVDQLDEVILVGGSTRIPRVQELVKEFFRKEPCRSVNPDEAVAVGAAIQAGVIRGELQEVLLLDVTPLSLGIELDGGVFKALIDRNSSLPCEATRKFTTVIDNQQSVMVHVLQGERLKAAENRSLAKFRLTGIPPMPKELPEIEVTFRIDANGILEVSAVDLTSGVNTGIQVEGYGECAPMNEEEINKLLEEVEAHSKEDREFMRTAQRRAGAERLQARMNKILEEGMDEIDEKDLKTIKETMLRLDLALSSRDWMMADTHEMTLQEIAEEYELMLNIGNQIGEEFEMPQAPPPPRREEERSQDKRERPATGEVPVPPDMHEGETAGEDVSMPEPPPAEMPPPAEKEPQSPAPPPRTRPSGPEQGADEPETEEDDFDPSNAPPPPPPS